VAKLTIGRLSPVAGALVVIGGGIMLGLVGYDFLTHGDHAPWWQAVPNVAIAWTFFAAGLIAWWRRPATLVGPLLLLVGAALLLRKLEYTDTSALFTIGFALSGLYAAMFAHVVLAYPSGHVRDRVEGWFVALAYGLALLLPVAVLLTFDSRRSCLFNCARADRARPDSVISVTGDPTVYGVVHRVQQIGGYGVVGALFIALIVRRLYLSSPRSRRRLGLLLAAGVLAGLRAVTDTVYSFVPRSDVDGLALFSVQEAIQFALPVVLLVALLRERLARASVADLVRELAVTPPSEVAGPVSRALGDPTLEVAFWMPARRGYVDAAGRPFDVPQPDARRAVTPIAQDGEPVAVLVHDPTLVQEPKLLDSVCTAARMSLENARLHAELQAQLRKVRESRTRIVAAADTERERIERDEALLGTVVEVALALDLRLAERELPASDTATKALLHSAVDSLQTAVEELRELAHGVYPALLTQSGLRAALDDLAGRTRGPVVVVDAPSQRLAPEVEATAYFVACEGLANAVKHSGARLVEITAVVEGPCLVVTILDDGAGDADSGGVGLAGLADRVEARGGRFWVDSPTGGGTRITAEIPCAS
jgi:signal transduction histidine kinase